MRDNKETTEDARLTEKNFVLDIGLLKGVATRSTPFPTQSHGIDITRELLSLHEEVETSLDRLHVSGKFLVTSVSHETCCRTAIPCDVTIKRKLMQTVEDTLQACCKRGCHVVKLHSDKQFEPEVETWRVNQDPIVKVSHFNTGYHAPREEHNNRTIQERGRTACYQFPHNHLPRELVRSM